MIDHLKKQLHHFFPGQTFSVSDIETGLEKGDIVTDNEQILPFLQTALFDEKVLEIELDGIPQVYFSRLKDDIPSFTEDGEADIIQDEFDYGQGDYLTTMSHIVTLPLEPGLGNLHLRNSRFIVLRMFTNTFAIELATTFQSLTKVADLPVLRLTYPQIARKVDNTRPYRAKVPEVMDFTVNIEADEKIPEMDTTPIDISIKGLAFSVSKNKQKMFIPGVAHSLKLYVNDELLVVITGTVRHLSRVRKKGSIEYVCGFEFNLETRTLTAVIESIVASVQRAHLKDLAEKSHARGIDLIA